MFKLLLAFSFLFNFAFAQDQVRVDAMRLWQKRDDSKSLSDALAKFEQLHQQKSDDLEVLTYLSRGFFLFADHHVEDKDQKMKTFEKAKNYGIAGLMTNTDYKALAAKDIKAAIEKLTAREVPLIFWTAAALGKWAKLNGVMASLKFKDQITGMVSQVEKLRPDFFYGSVPRYWGGYYAIAPGFVGGSMKKSKENFKKAMAMAPDYFGTKVLYAETYCVEEDDKKEFKKVLEEVVASPIAENELKPENILEQRKAQKLLGQVDKLF